jgi:elongation factor 2
MKKLWGDNFFSPEEKKFTTDCNAADGTMLPRCFVQFIMKPIIMLCRNCMEGKMDAVYKMIESLGLSLKTDEKEKRSKDLFKCVFQKWINAADALIEMIIMKLPSPRKAQKYRCAALYEGP